MNQRARWTVTLFQTGRRYAEYVITTLGVIVFLAWVIEPSRVWLESHGIISENAVLALVGLGLAIVIGGVQELRSIVEPLIKTATSRIVDNGVSGVYEALDHVIREKSGTPIPRRKARRIEVLGLTLFSAWPHLCGFLEDSKN